MHTERPNLNVTPHLQHASALQTVPLGSALALVLQSLFGLVFFKEYEFFSAHQLLGMGFGAFLNVYGLKVLGRAAVEEKEFASAMDSEQGKALLQNKEALRHRFSGGAHFDLIGEAEAKKYLEAQQKARAA